MDCYWIRNTEYDLKALCRESKGVAVLPLASIESHGPHLPLGSDILCAENLLERIARRETVAILPVLTYSFVASARMLPGAIHMPSDLLIRQVEAICDEVHRNGFDKIVLLHCHGGNVALHEMFTRHMLEQCKPYTVYSLPVFGTAASTIAAMADTETGHACELETSMNLAAVPELVKLERLGKKTFPTQPAGDIDNALTAVDWTIRHPEMAVGEPQKASAEKGERILAAWADAIAATLAKIKADRRTPAAVRRYNRRVAQPRDAERRKRD